MAEAIQWLNDKNKNHKVVSVKYEKDRNYKKKNCYQEIVIFAVKPCFIRCGDGSAAH